MAQARTFPALVDEMAARHPDRDYLIDGDRRWSYARFRREVRTVAKGLLALGIRPGDKVALLMGNRAEWLVADFAVTSIGATLVAVNTWFRTHELAYVLGHCDCAALITVDRYLRQDYLAMLAEIGVGTDRFPLLRHRICLMEDDGPVPAGMLAYEALAGLGAGIADAALDAVSQAVRPDDIAYILYTSGTTAAPKGAQLCHGGVIENGFGIGERQHLTGDDRLWMGISLFWAFGCENALPAIMTHGGTIVIQRAFEPAEALALIERERCSVYYATPNITLALWEHPDRLRRDLTSLRTGISLGSPEAMRLVMALGAHAICQCYGLTEVYGNCSLSDAGEPEDSRATRCGRALPGTEIRVADPLTGATLPAGEVGELRVRGHVMPGYYKDAERNAEAFDAQGWFRSGDLGWLDADGFVHFHSRLKEMLKSGGIMVAPREIEDFLGTFAEVGEAHAVSVPDPRKQEVIACAILLKRGAALDAAELVRRCRTAMATYKVPAHLWFVREEELPRTATGKVQKFRLRDAFLARLGLDADAGH